MSEPSEHVHLREYVERIFAEQEKQLIQTARELERRLEGLNQLREEVLKDRAIFLQKDVYQQMHNAICDRVQKLEGFQAKTLGFGAALILLAGVIGAIISHLFGK